jgi:hypothetical protein
MIPILHGLRESAILFQTASSRFISRDGAFNLQLWDAQFFLQLLKVNSNLISETACCSVSMHTPRHGASFYSADLLYFFAFKETVFLPGSECNWKKYNSELDFDPDSLLGQDVQT